MTKTCPTCSQPITDITEDDVLRAVGYDHIALTDLLNTVGGTLSKRSKIITGLITRGILVLTAERTVHRYVPYNDIGQPCGGMACDGEQLLCSTCSEAAQRHINDPGI